MAAKVFIGVLFSCACLARMSAQEVDIVRDKTPQIPKADAVAPKQATAEFHIEKAIPVQPLKPPTTAPKPAPATAQVQKQEPKVAAQSPMIEVRPKQAAAAAVSAPKTQKPEIAKTSTPSLTASSTPVKLAVDPKPAASPRKTEVASSSPSNEAHAEKILTPPLNIGGATAFTKLAGGFDFPIGKPDAQGYYKARGFQTHGHLGEDWDGVGGGDTDMGDPVFCIGDGVVVFARDCHQGWGNVIIVRHAYKEGGTVKNIDSLYAHCQKILVRRGQAISRGQQIAAIGNAHGLYDAHLHFEIRKNIAIGMSRDKFAKDLSNYSDPTQFIAAHRHLQSAGGNYRVAMNTFTHDERIRWDKLRNYSRAHTGGGSKESSRALKKALVSQTDNARPN